MNNEYDLKKISYFLTNLFIQEFKPTFTESNNLQNIEKVLCKILKNGEIEVCQLINLINLNINYTHKITFFLWENTLLSLRRKKEKKTNFTLYFYSISNTIVEKISYFFKKKLKIEKHDILKKINYHKSYILECKNNCRRFKLTDVIDVEGICPICNGPLIEIESNKLYSKKTAELKELLNLINSTTHLVENNPELVCSLLFPEFYSINKTTTHQKMPCVTPNNLFEKKPFENKRQQKIKKNLNEVIEKGLIVDIDDIMSKIKKINDKRTARKYLKILIQENNLHTIICTSNGFKKEFFTFQKLPLERILSKSKHDILELLKKEPLTRLELARALNKDTLTIREHIKSRNGRSNNSLIGLKMIISKNENGVFEITQTGRNYLKNIVILKEWLNINMDENPSNALKSIMNL